jgi:integral membrane protein
LPEYKRASHQLSLQTMKSSKIFHWFRIAAIAEGISFLVLLGIAMPLKYLVNIPIAVTITGSIHGLLFITFIWLAWEVKNKYNKNGIWAGKAFLASILPFGTIVMDKQWKKEEDSEIKKELR